LIADSTAGERRIEILAQFAVLLTVAQDPGDHPEEFPDDPQPLWIRATPGSLDLEDQTRYSLGPRTVGGQDHRCGRRPLCFGPSSFRHPGFVVPA